MEERTKTLFAELSADPAIRILPRAEPFNYSRLNNAAAREATGQVLVLLNNDVDVIGDDWLRPRILPRPDRRSATIAPWRSSL